jgi:hypothetical protein
VEINRVGFCRTVAAPLVGGHVEQNRFFKVFNVFQDINELVQAVAFNGSEIFEIKGLKKHARGDKGLEGFLCPLGKVVGVAADLGQGAEQFAEILSLVLDVFGGKRAAQKRRQGSHIGRNRHFIVI